MQGEFAPQTDTAAEHVGQTGSEPIDRGIAGGVVVGHDRQRDRRPCRQLRRARMKEMLDEKEIKSTIDDVILEIVKVSGAAKK